MKLFLLKHIYLLTVILISINWIKETKKHPLFIRILPVKRKVCFWRISCVLVTCIILIDEANITSWAQRISILFFRQPKLVSLFLSRSPFSSVLRQLLHSINIYPLLSLNYSLPLLLIYIMQKTGAFVVFVHYIFNVLDVQII